jgi:hypothetical protein
VALYLATSSVVLHRKKNAVGELDQSSRAQVVMQVLANARGECLSINCEYHRAAFTPARGDELGYSRKPVPRVLPILLGNKLLG